MTGFHNQGRIHTLPTACGSTLAEVLSALAKLVRAGHKMDRIFIVLACICAVGESVLFGTFTCFILGEGIWDAG